MTLKEAYLKSREILLPVYGKDDALSISRRLFEDYFHIAPNRIITDPDRSFDQTAELEACLRRLLAHEPVQHISGFEVFCGLKIMVSPDVLIPRPETEELVQWVIASATEHTKVIADICTGSGCIALAFKKALPHVSIIATDISGKALQMAVQNEALNFSDKTVQFLQHDILHEQWTAPMPDIIVCNPPYIAWQESAAMEKNVLEYEPHLALFVEHEDPLLFYKRIIDLFLSQHSVQLFFELNPLTADALNAYCLKKEVQSEFRSDLYGKIRFARIYR